MSRKRWMGTIGAFVGLALSLAGETARAESYVPPDATCDASVCMHPPPLDAVTPASGTMIPANQPRIVVPYGVYRLIERASGDEIPTEIRTDIRGYRLALLTTLTEGSEIALQVSVCEGLEGIVATWTVGPAVPTATSLGTLSLSEVRPPPRATRADATSIALSTWRPSSRDGALTTRFEGAMKHPAGPRGEACDVRVWFASRDGRRRGGRRVCVKRGARAQRRHSRRDTAHRGSRRVCARPSRPRCS